MKITNKSTGEVVKEAKVIYDTSGIVSFVEIESVYYDPSAFEFTDAEPKEVKKQKPQAKTSSKK